LQFSFRSKEKYEKKYKPHRGSGLGELDEGNESYDSDLSAKVAAMSEADVERSMEQMLVSIFIAKLIFFYEFRNLQVVILQVFHDEVDFECSVLTPWNFVM